MKTLTEFSTLMLRKAAEARATVPTTHAAVSADGASATDSTDHAISVEPGIEAAPDAPIEAGSEPAPGEAAETASQSQEVAAAPSDESETSASPAGESAGDAGPDLAADPAVAAVASACGVQPDRAARLLEALDIIGRDVGPIDRVRLVRVYQGEKGPHNAISRGEFHYVIDRVVAPARDRRNSGHGAHSGRDQRDRPSGGGGSGGSFRGSDRKPRGLGSLKFGASPEAKDPSDERPGRGEMPRAGIGWQLTPSPRTAEDFARGLGRRRPPSGRKPRGTRGGPHGRGGEQRPQTPKSFQPVNGDVPPSPRAAADAQPLPPRKKRPRKPLGPDANGLGPDGTPWDPERRAKRLAERQEKVNEVRPDPVQVGTESGASSPPEGSK